VFSSSSARRVLAAAVAALGLANVALVAYTIVARVRYGYDLEWMEGGMLLHAMRVRSGASLYTAPSIEFIPYLYTPLYPALVALVSPIAGGIDYPVARAVSIAGFIAAIASGAAIVRPHARSAVMLAPLAIAVGAYAATGSFVDLARPDGLWLGLVGVSALLIDRAGRRERPELLAAAAGAMMVLAFLTKQTAAPMMLASIAATALVAGRRAAAVHVAALAVLGLPILWWFERSSGGWFSTYVFRIHRVHPFYAKRAFLETPWTLVRILGPVVALWPWALLRSGVAPEMRRSLFVCSLFGAAGIAASCIGFGTQWAFHNAYLPGVVFPAFAVAMSFVILAPERPVLAQGATVASLSLVLFDPRPLVPTDSHLAAGDALVARLRDAPGEVLIPSHPYYAHLAGKRTFVHRMGLLDVFGGGLEPPAGLLESLRGRRFALIVIDGELEHSAPVLPGLLFAYSPVERLNGPATLSGEPTKPSWLLVPRGARP